MIRKNRRTDRAAKAGRRYTVVTNNWLCDLAWQRQTGLMFDERLQFSGGSDTHFYHAALRLGARAQWCPDAVVNEEMERQRLTLRNQFHRAIMQSIQHFRRSHNRISPRVVAETLLMATLRCVSGSLLLVFPVMGLASLTVGVRSVGWAVGRLQALAGAQSSLYLPSSALSAPRTDDPD